MMLRKLAATGSALVALAGCSGRAGDAAATPAPSSNQAAAVELAKCMRANGYPAFPDPVKDDKGRWDFPTDTIGDWLPADACRPLVPAWKAMFADAVPVSADEMAKLREHARCMREHGLEDFPDPGEDGKFPLPDRLKALADDHDPAFAAAYEACQQLLPPDRVSKD